MINHRHTGEDAPRVLAEDVEGAATDSSVVKLTGNQTVAGVKTFTSVPVLPASNPATDNQAVRKAYADSKFGGIETISSATLRDSADNIAQIPSDQLTYEKYKEIEFNNFDGDITVKFDLQMVFGSDMIYGRIYINGVAVGTERKVSNAGYTTFSEDISVSQGDLVQLYCHMQDDVHDGQARNFRLYYDSSLVLTPGDIELN